MDDTDIITTLFPGGLNSDVSGDHSPERSEISTAMPLQSPLLATAPSSAITPEDSSHSSKPPIPVVTPRSNAKRRKPEPSGYRISKIDSDNDFTLWVPRQDCPSNSSHARDIDAANGPIRTHKTNTIHHHPYGYQGCVPSSTLLNRDPSPSEITYTDGSTYFGDVFEGQKQGYGCIRYPNGDTYEGFFINDRATGQGTMMYSSGETQIGEFIDGKLHGEGATHFADGSLYRGSFDAGLAHGRGAIHYSYGNVFEGVFQHGIKHGPGFLIHADGTRVSGYYINGVLEGEGGIKYPGGTTYIGQFLNGLEHGRGTLIAPNGYKIKGVFFARKLHGPATLEAPDGATVSTSTWQHGQYLGAWLEPQEATLPPPIESAKSL